MRPSVALAQSRAARANSSGRIPVRPWSAALLVLLALSCAHAPGKISFEQAEQEQFPPELRREALLAKPGPMLASAGDFLPRLALTAWPSGTGMAGGGNCSSPSASCSAASFTTTGASTAATFAATTNGTTTTPAFGIGNYGMFKNSSGTLDFAVGGSDAMQLAAASGAVSMGSGYFFSAGTGNPAVTFDAIGTGIGFRSAAASTTNGFACTTNGCRFDFGAGASDYASSDGTTVTFAGPVTSAGQFSVTAGSGNVIITTDSIYAVALRQKSGVTNAPVKMLSESTDGASAVAGATDTTTAWSTTGAKLHSFRTNAVEKAAITVNGAVNPDFTDDSATTGNRTVNKPAGINAYAAAGTAITITNSVVKATSLVYAQLQTADATCTFIKSVVPAAGSFVATVNAGCTGTTKIGWIVFNGN